MSDHISSTRETQSHARKFRMRVSIAPPGPVIGGGPARGDLGALNGRNIVCETRDKLQVQENTFKYIVCWCVRLRVGFPCRPANNRPPAHAPFPRFPPHHVLPNLHLDGIFLLLPPM